MHPEHRPGTSLAALGSQGVSLPVERFATRLVARREQHGHPAVRGPGARHGRQSTTRRSIFGIPGEVSLMPQLTITAG